jgi:hypothetical protein
MKKLLAILVLLALIAGMFFLFRTKQPPAPQPVGHNETSSNSALNIPVVQSKTQSVPPAAIAPNVPAQIAPGQTELASRAASPISMPAAGADTNAPPTLSPPTVLDKTRVTIHNYHAAFGENPVGTNPEIAAALQGKNPRQINFLAESGLRLNGKGEIVDGYGIPFFFHQISGNEMEIRSAGPDKVMWTSDDLVTR